jgi:hypothetical protein
MGWPEEKKNIRRLILDLRDNVFNDSNPLRTDYYFRFWNLHNEIPWALLANLVSRNAGYQMSDLSRYLTWGALTPGLYAVLTFGQMRAFFAMLESGNFLILRDILPQLEAYRAAKRLMRTTDVDHSTELFDMLLHPDFDADPFIVEAWKTFFAQARAQNWSPAWASDWSRPEIQTMSLSLIVNEQNQIEDRLVNDPVLSVQYLGLFGITTVGLVALINWLNATRLCFPMAPTAADPVPKLLIHTVTGFTDLSGRIQTGRALYAGLFLDTAIRDRVIAWAKEHQVHHGTRLDYNPTNYSLSPVTNWLPRGARWSPPLVYFRSTVPAWYDIGPGHTMWYKGLYATPIGLASNVTPHQVQHRPGFNYAPLLAPMTHTPLSLSNADQLDEIIDPI